MRFIKQADLLAWRGIDLTKIESRPLKTALGEYFFIVDVENKNDTLVSFALEELNVLGIDYKILSDVAMLQTVKSSDF